MPRPLADIAAQIEDFAHAGRLHDVAAHLPRLRAEIEVVLKWLAENTAKDAA